MADVVVESEVDTEGRTVACAKISGGEWEVNIRATPLEFAELGAIRTATWAARKTIAAGTAAGTPVFWACDGSHVSILIGADDETWDVAVSVPVDDVDRIVELAGEL